MIPASGFDPRISATRAGSHGGIAGGPGFEFNQSKFPDFPVLNFLSELESRGGEES